MKRLLYILMLMQGTVLHASAQGLPPQPRPLPLYLQMNGQLLQTSPYEHFTSGSPYYHEDFRPATILLKNGIIINSLPVKLDLLNHQLHYKDSLDRLMSLSGNVKSVTFDGPGGQPQIFVTALAFEDAGADAPKGWYELVYKGKASLLKQYHKVIRESQRFGSSLPDQFIETEVRYYVWHKKYFTRVKNLRELADELSNAKVDRWLQGRKLQSKSESDLIAMLAYYEEI